MNSAGVLNKKYDAASANWGSTWRMPTKAEFDELISKCTWTWTTQGGHAGYRVTGTNGKSIFLPAAGDRYGSSSYIYGSFGGFWSSSAYDDTDFAYYLYFYGGYHDMVWRYRHGGFSIRPVSQ